MEINDYMYPFDLNGTKQSNWISQEIATTSEINGEDYNIILPKLGPIHVNDLIVKHVDSGKELKPFVDFTLLAPFKALATQYERATFGMIAVKNKNLTGTWEISYRTLGGGYCLDYDQMLEDLANYAFNPREISYDDIAPDTIPEEFPPMPHGHDINDDVYYTVDIIFALNKIALSITGDQEPNHQHDIEDVTDLQKELDARVDKYGNYKLGVTEPYYAAEHFGAVALELPVETIGCRVDAEIVVGMPTGKIRIELGGVVTAEGDWTDRYAVSEGNNVAQTAAMGMNTNGKPYIWLGDDTTHWQEVNFSCASVLLNSEDPAPLWTGWKFGIVEFPEDIVTTIEITPGGLVMDGFVPTSRMVNGQALTKDIVLSALDVEAVPANKQGQVETTLWFADNSKAYIKAKGETNDTYMISIVDNTMEFGDQRKQTILNGNFGSAPAIRLPDGLSRILTEKDDIGGTGSANYVPTSRKINNKALTEDINLDYDDVGAVPRDSKGVTNTDVIVDATHTYFHQVNGNKRKLVDQLAIEDQLYLQHGAQGAITALYSAGEAPVVIIGSTVYELVVKGLNDGLTGLTVNTSLESTAGQDSEGNDLGSVDLIGVTNTDGAVATNVSNTAGMTTISTKAKLKVKTATTSGLYVPFVNAKNEVVNEAGQDANVIVRPGKGLTSSMADTEVNIISFMSNKTEVGDITVPMDIIASERPNVIVGEDLEQMAFLSDLAGAGGTDFDPTAERSSGLAIDLDSYSVSSATGAINLTYEQTVTSDSINFITESAATNDNNLYTLTASDPILSSPRGVTFLTNTMDYDLLNFNVVAIIDGTSVEDPTTIGNVKLTSTYVNVAGATLLLDEIAVITTNTDGNYVLTVTTSALANFIDVTDPDAPVVADFSWDIYDSLSDDSMVTPISVITAKTAVQPNGITWLTGVDTATGDFIISNSDGNAGTTFRFTVDGQLITTKDHVIDDTAVLDYDPDGDA